MKKILDVEKSDIRAALEEAEVRSHPGVGALGAHQHKSCPPMLYPTGDSGTRGDQNPAISDGAAADQD